MCAHSRNRQYAACNTLTHTIIYSVWPYEIVCIRLAAVEFSATHTVQLEQVFGGTVLWSWPTFNINTHKYMVAERPAYDCGKLQHCIRMLAATRYWRINMRSEPDPLPPHPSPDINSVSQKPQRLNEYETTLSIKYAAASKRHKQQPKQQPALSPGRHMVPSHNA